MDSVTTTGKLALTPPMLHDIEYYKKEGIYFYLEATQELLPNGRVNVVNYGEMIMLGSYSYLGLIGHPKINAAAKEAIDKYGTGTHGVRLLAGSLDLHNQLEARIARFKKTDEDHLFQWLCHESGDDFQFAAQGRHGY
ncbi:MAG: aminotransferase class I/II-fold pyridoxal phosphate-dependent enzyme [Chloroflexi bacterium]|nr:aminotransferase class I/II-fold pyridoxal phosphate-dependent enzyme [Chloroflexota bacterium]